MSFDVRRSRQTIFGQSTEFLIGEMLVKAGVIKQSQLDDALKLAGNKHMQIGQMLIMAHYITPRDLQAAIDAQVAVRDRVMEANTALRALHTACRNGMSFAEASQKQSQDAPVTAAPNQLGDLLLEANLINAEQLSIALQKSMATGLPVGRILILNNVISEAILSSALEMRIKLRDGAISGEEAVAYLRDLSRTKEINDLGLARLEQASFSGSDKEGEGRRGIRLGEFLVLAGILSETDVMNALEFSLVSEKPLGRTLVEHGYVTNELIDAAIKLQSLVESDTLDCQKAALCLSNIHINSVTLAQAIEAITSETVQGTRIDFQNFLLDSNLITSAGMQSALELAVNNPRMLSKILVQTGYLREDQAAIIIDSHEAIIQNLISEQDAKFVLDFCLQKLPEGPISFAQGLEELGWSGADDPSFIAQITGSEATVQDNMPFVQASPQTVNPTIAAANIEPKGADLMRSMLGSSPPPAQSFIADPNSSFSSLPAQSLNAPAPSTQTKASSNPTKSPQSQPDQQPVSQSGHRTGRTTTNMPALTQIQAGAELMRPPPEDTEHVDAAQIDSSHHDDIATQSRTIPPKPEQSVKAHAGPVRAADRSLSLKSLLKQEESRPVASPETKPPSGSDSPGSVGGNGKTQGIELEKKQESKAVDDSLELSESEKALIIKASSLTASPDEIMAAMKLAARKDKIIQVHDKDEKD